MLLNIVTQQPRMLLTIVQHTPSWVWMVLAALIWLGASQFFARSIAGLASGAAEPYRPGGFFRLGHRMALWRRATAGARQPISVCNVPTKA